MLLCFSPQTLQRDNSLMRTLVDRHYADNWVVPWGQGCSTDLAVEWESFPAARAALTGAVSVARAKDVAAAAVGSMPELEAKIAAHLSKGQLSVRHLTLCQLSQRLPSLCDVCVLARKTCTNATIIVTLCQSKQLQPKLVQ